MTVKDGQEEPFRDREGEPSPRPFEYRSEPISRSPRLHQSLTAQGVDGNFDPSCDTTVCHTAPSEPPPNRYPIRVSDDSGCSTAVCHNGPEPFPRLSQPSGRSQRPSARPSEQRSRRQPCGLIVRGRVFYLRMRVPRGLVEKVGRTHWVRSLGTGCRGEAVRRAIGLGLR
jgi:hypothetical protein